MPIVPHLTASSAKKKLQVLLQVCLMVIKFAGRCCGNSSRSLKEILFWKSAVLEKIKTWFFCQKITKDITFCRAPELRGGNSMSWKWCSYFCGAECMLLEGTEHIEGLGRSGCCCRFGVRNFFGGFDVLFSFFLPRFCVSIKILSTVTANESNLTAAGEGANFSEPLSRGVVCFIHKSDCMQSLLKEYATYSF